MSFSTLKIPLPYALFFGGVFPAAIGGSFLLLMSTWEDPGAPLMIFAVYLGIMTYAFTVFGTPICFLVGFFMSLKFTGKQRVIGLTLNGLGIAVLLSILVYNWLTN